MLFRTLLQMERRGETRRYMHSVHQLANERQFIAIKGNPSDVLTLCETYFDETGVQRLTDGQRSLIDPQNATMTGDGLRDLPIANMTKRQSGTDWLECAIRSDRKYRPFYRNFKPR